MEVAPRYILLTWFTLFTWFTLLLTPVVESMRTCEPGLQAPSNLAGSKTKNAHIFWSIGFFSKLRNYNSSQAPQAPKYVAT